MKTLSYPDVLPPSLGEGRADLFPVITEDALVVGMAMRRYCHSGAMVLHPVVHLHVIDRLGRLYLQQRSMTKDIAPGRWDTSVGGHVDFGEQLHQAVLREAREELDIHLSGEMMTEGVRPVDGEVDKLVFLFQYLWQSSRERELVTAFAVCYDGVLQPDKEEVADGRFWAIDDLCSCMQSEPMMFTDQFREAEWPRLRTLLS